MSVFALTYAGLINLFTTCKPLNKYRALLFFTSTICVTAIILFAIIFGLPALEFSKMLPVKEFWHHHLIVITIILLDIPLSLLLQKAFEKFNALINKKS